MNDTIGIVGLGLIGGSLAKAIVNNTGCRVLGCDIKESVVCAALEDGVIAGRLDRGSIADCSIIIIALYPEDVIEYCKDNMAAMNEGTIVVDCAGVKTRIVKEVSALAKNCGVRFVGGHPMAGIERSGYESSFAGLFDGATMILCKDEILCDEDVLSKEDNIRNDALEILKDLFLSIGFGRVKITTAREHDEIIAYTSQLAHLVSSAYIKSDTMKKRYGFSAGSFKDLTRVARLDEEMWTELFFENSQNLLKEIDVLTENIRKYRDALASSDEGAMKDLLIKGKELKSIYDKMEQEWMEG